VGVIVVAAMSAAAWAAEPQPAAPSPATWLQEEHAELQSLLSGPRKMFRPNEKEVFRREAMILSEDRDPTDVVARRTAALLTDIEARLPADALAKQREQLETLRAEIAKTPIAETESRYRLFESVCQLRRQVALKNPLLSFDKILFAKKHRSKYNHMVDQYLGFHALPGGGIYVLDGAFGDQPKLRDVLAGAKVENGRLAGKALEGGAFLSPELSCDGKTILFAYVEQGDRPYPRAYNDRNGGWGDPTICFHIFSVNVDGTNLRQLTDGPWNDFDPCFLPNGRIIFISERRGGLGRCHGGRLATTYTVHAMNPDGGELVPLSYHETNEWHPSVLNDGMIAYTRWDYVDRGPSEAHHPWTMYPDGRDPRAIHGNYGGGRPRANMVMDLRAIPDSTLIVGTAAGHHAQAYGSFVLLDVARREEDGKQAQSQLRRLTPQVLLPEADGHAEHHQIYATAWPLSEDYYLCVWSPVGHVGPQGTTKEISLAHPPYKVCLLDSFGNREVLYEDPKIACISPIPLRARPTPPVIPDAIDVARRGEVPACGKPSEATGTIACMNVYDSRLPWPEGTKIKGLRIVQVYPFPGPQQGRIGAGTVPISMTRSVIGTVPIEADGSVHFEAPAGKVLYFQALDEKGLAVQTMKSATWVAPGERLVCQGCHAGRHDAPSVAKGMSLAMRRAPSKITTDVPGTDPILFSRLVQPVLDKHCVACHQKEADKAPSMAGTLATREHVEQAHATAKRLKQGIGVDRNMSTGYVGLAPFVWNWWAKPDGTTSVPGKIGARASPLYELLSKGHHDVKLSPEELHRLTVWLDCDAPFFGAYTKLPDQARGEVVRPELE
jgi:hypothetical protein